VTGLVGSSGDGGTGRSTSVSAVKENENIATKLLLQGRHWPFKCPTSRYSASDIRDFDPISNVMHGNINFLFNFSTMSTLSSNNWLTPVVASVERNPNKQAPRCLGELRITIFQIQYCMNIKPSSVPSCANYLWTYHPAKCDKPVV